MELLNRSKLQSKQPQTPRILQSCRSKKERPTEARIVVEEATTIDAMEAVATEVRPSASARPVVKNMQENAGISKIEEGTDAIPKDSSPRKMHSTT